MGIITILKYIIYEKIFFLLSIVLLSCSTEKKEVTHKIVLKNNSSLVRNAEPIIISKEKVDAVFGSLGLSENVYFENSTGEKIPFQKDDFSGKIELLSILLISKQSSMIS